MIKAGAAAKVINNSLGTPIQGATVSRIAESIRDDLEANALFLSDSSESILLVSCDLAGLLPEFVAPVRDAMGKAAGIDSRSIIIACTHTHSGPSLLPTNYLKDLDREYMKQLQVWLVELAREAVEAACPARIGIGLGKTQIGYNRRCCWEDGTHTMRGDINRPDFTGLEGPDDPQHLAFFAEDMDGKLIAIIHNNTSHPACFYGRDFYSSDFPGAARKYLRESLGNIPVLFLNGAFGDINIENMLSPRLHRETDEQKVFRTGHLMAGETLRLLHESEFQEDIILAHAYEDLHISVRLPDAEKADWAEKTLAPVDSGETIDPWDMLLAHGTALLMKEFADNPIDIVPVHVLRIGDTLLVTQSCELYCQFGIDIKRRSPSQHTAICSITDGYNGYCPTLSGVLGGGYSGEPIWWTRLSPEGGYQIVDCAARLMNQIWQE
jgi:hypothetical protein